MMQVQDKLLAAAFGRPASINAPVFNVRPLELGDFESSDNYALNRKSVLFIEYAKLASILSRLLDLQTLSPENPTAEVLPYPATFYA